MSVAGPLCSRGRRSPIAAVAWASLSLRMVTAYPPPPPVVVCAPSPLRQPAVDRHAGASSRVPRLPRCALRGPCGARARTSAHRALGRARPPVCRCARVFPASLPRYVLGRTREGRRAAPTCSLGGASSALLTPVAGGCSSAVVLTSLKPLRPPLGWEGRTKWGGGDDKGPEWRRMRAGYRCAVPFAEAFSF